MKEQEQEQKEELVRSIYCSGDYNEIFEMFDISFSEKKKNAEHDYSSL
jgi:hypothetical protein